MFVYSTGMAVLTTTPQEQADLALERQLAEQAAHVHAGTARLVALLSEYDRSGCWEGPGIRSVEHRAGIDLGLDPATARRYVILARGLRDRPVVAEAFAAGRLSPAKAELVVRACDPDPASQTHWVDVATAATPTQLARIVRAWDTVRDDPAPAATAHRRRSLRIAGADEAGMVRLTALLPAEDAAVVRAALDAHAEAAWREHQGDPVGDPAVDADDPGAARLADALVALAETGLAAGPTPCVGGDRHAVTVHVHAGAVSGIDPTTPDGPDAPARRGRCHLRDGTPLDASAARRIACEAAVRPLFENALRQPLDLGRTRRVVTTAQRRLVETRDGGCAFPGCPHTRHLDIHHIVHWLDGGPTDVANLVALCRHHHRAHHHGAYRMVAATERGTGPPFTAPDGTPIAPPAPPPGSDAVLRATNPAGIDHRTAAAGDGGAPIGDLGLVIEAAIGAHPRLQC